MRYIRMGAGAGSSPPGRRNSKQAKTKAYLWFQRNGSKLVATDIICIVLLFILYLFPSTLPLFIDESVNGIQIAAIILVSFIAISVIWKGIVRSHMRIRNCAYP